MGLVNFVKSALKSVAQAATDDDKIYFPTDGQSIWLNGKEYGSDPTSPHFCYFCTCATAAATAAKVVACTDFKQLVVGAIIGVRFTYTNTASNVTLNVNGTGAKQVRYNTGVNTGNSSMLFGYAGRTVFYMWDGTYWMWISYGTDSGNAYTSVHCTTAAGEQLCACADWNSEHGKKCADAECELSRREAYLDKRRGEFGNELYASRRDVPGVL